MTVWMFCSSTLLKKEISTFAVLIVQALLEVVVEEEALNVPLFSECIVTGTIVSLCFDM